MLENVFEDVCAMFARQSEGKDQEKEDDTVKTIVKSIKNVMFDRCAVKKFNNLFTNCRKEILPTLVEEWEPLSEEERCPELTNTYACSCWFADQAQVCCKI